MITYDHFAVGKAFVEAFGISHLHPISIDLHIDSKGATLTIECKVGTDMLPNLRKFSVLPVE